MVANVEAGTDGTVSPSAPGGRTPAAGSRPVSRVLVVDDDPDINRLVRVRLTTRGYEVESAANGVEALATIAEAVPDLMFLDVSMPGMTGMEVLEQLRARYPDLGVIMMTAFGSEEVAIEALRNGADDYLRKPFERAEFVAVLERTVSRIELRRENTFLQHQLDEKRRQLEAELARAAQVQADLLPERAPSVPGFSLAARFLPAREVGGDFYDWYQAHNGTLTFTLGDVMGKGMPAALLMATARAALRAVARESGPGAAVDAAAAALAADFARTDGFVTLFHAQLDVASRRLTFVDAGHGHSFVRRAGGEVASLSPRGLPLGILEEASDEGRLDFQPGDSLVIYSDGLPDARPELELDRDALAAEIQGARDADEIAARLTSLATAGGALPDDLTVLVVCCQAP